MTTTKRFRMKVPRRQGESDPEWAQRNREWRYEESPSWLDMFKHFTKTTLFRAYQQWCEAEHLDDRKETVGPLLRPKAEEHYRCAGSR